VIPPSRKVNFVGAAPRKRQVTKRLGDAQAAIW
jgi:hypothetical protein